MSAHPMDIPGCVRLAPGAYAAGDTLHVVEEEALAAAGFADTPENRAALRAAMVEVGREIGAVVTGSGEEEDAAAVRDVLLGIHRRAREEGGQS